MQSTFVSIALSFILAATAVAQHDRVVMFSSYGSTRSYDYNGDSWSNRASGSSLGGAEMAIAYDAESDRVIMFSSYGSTRAYDYGADSWENRTSGSSLGGASLGLAYDAESDRTIMFSSYGSTRAYDYNTDTWQNRTSGSSLGGAQMQLAYDVESDRVIMFSSYGSTRAYDYNTDTWENRASGSSLGGAECGLAYDVESDRVIMFSSYGSTRAYDYNTDSWENRTSGSSLGGASLGLAYDAESDRVIMFSSYGSTRAYDYNTDTWENRTSGSSLGGAEMSLAYVGPVTPNAPECTITSPMGGTVSGDTTIAFDVITPSGNPATAALEFSTDTGLSWTPATDAGGGTLTGNPTAAFSAGSQTWQWDSDADLPMAPTNVIFRITTSDGVTGYFRRCEVTVDVDNVPTCTITNPGAGALLGGTSPISLDVAAPAGNDFEATFEYSTDAGATFSPATNGAGGSLVGNPTAPASAGSHSWSWDTPVDVPLSATAVILRVTVADALTGSSSTCSETYDVDNVPTCVITAPAAGAQLSGSSAISFSVTPPSGNLWSALLELSTDGGATFQPATDAGGGTLRGNPTPPAAAGSYSWQWDTHADIPFARSNVLLRIAVRDVVTSATSDCQRLYDVDNNVMCTVTAPAGVVRGPVTIDVTETTTAVPPEVNVTVEWSPAGMGAFSLCTMTATSPHPNPLLAAPAGAHPFEWDSVADGVAPGGPENFDLRVTVSDAGAVTSCSTTVQIDNSSACATFCGDCDSNGLGPTILDALTAAQIAAGTVTPTLTQMACCDTDSTMTINVLDVLKIAQSAAGIPVTLTCP